MKRLLSLVLILLMVQPTFACLILVLTDGKRVLVGNHEDWYAQDSEVVVELPTKDTYGFIGFAFASEGLLQGGMNTAGLFFDGTATPFVPLDFSDKPAFQGYFWRQLLASCATVAEAVTLLQQYQLPEMQRIHVAFADKGGASVVVGAYKGQLVFHYRTALAYQVVTNFNLSNPSYGNEPVCSRYQQAMAMLQADSSATIGNVQQILAQTTQPPLTVYSNIYDLTNGEVYVFNKADFTRFVTLNLAEELSKGSHRRRLEALFK